MPQDAKEHSALLKDHLAVTKDLLQEKKQKVAELEYQWVSVFSLFKRPVWGVSGALLSARPSPFCLDTLQGTSKAQLAQAKAEAEEALTDCEIMEDIIKEVNRVLVKGPGDLRVSVLVFRFLQLLRFSVCELCLRTHRRSSGCPAFHCRVCASRRTPGPA